MNWQINHHFKTCYHKFALVTYARLRSLLIFGIANLLLHFCFIETLFSLINFTYSKSSTQRYFCTFSWSIYLINFILFIVSLLFIGSIHLNNHSKSLLLLSCILKKKVFVRFFLRRKIFILKSVFAVELKLGVKNWFHPRVATFYSWFIKYTKDRKKINSKNFLSSFTKFDSNI